MSYIEQLRNRADSGTTGTGDGDSGNSTLDNGDSGRGDSLQLGDGNDGSSGTRSRAAGTKPPRRNPPGSRTPRERTGSNTVKPGTVAVSGLVVQESLTFLLDIVTDCLVAVFGEHFKEAKPELPTLAVALSKVLEENKGITKALTNYSKYIELAMAISAVAVPVYLAGQEKKNVQRILLANSTNTTGQEPGISTATNEVSPPHTESETNRGELERDAERVADLSRWHSPEVP